MEVISAWELYLWTRLDVFGSEGYQAIVIFSLILGAIAWFLLTLWSDDVGEDKLPSYLKIAKRVFVMGIILAVLSMVVPSKKEMAMIYVIPKLSNSQTIQTEANEIYTIAKEALREMLPSKEVDNPQ